MNDRLAHTIARLKIEPVKIKEPILPPRTPRLYQIDTVHDPRYDAGLELHLLRYSCYQTVKELAARTGLSNTTIHKLERGRLCNLHTLSKIAAELGLRVKISFEKPEENDGVSLFTRQRKRIHD